ncbi:PREDICTED: zinc finger protein 708-like [Papilio xuthus]|uniref:Zinc finger protein 708-like n=1 Tax=Papilio xuthus TaxID=66420 RepID=A0AAJ6Z1Y1_PAPXU|nr:PREDICTED: zinc finger protein 708-like [Papilio xuthus]
MNSNIITRYGNAICEGCLSIDRKLTTITDADNLKIYFDLLEENQINELILCWECKANVRKLATFRRQVKKAHNTLLNHLINESMNLTSLTKLSILRLDPLNIDTENPLMDSLMDTEQIQPMTFVKLESPQNVSMESEDCDLDIKLDTTDPFITKENCHSDEEPLTNKKTTRKKVGKNPKKNKSTSKKNRTKDKKDKEKKEISHGGEVIKYTMHSIKTLKRLNMVDNEYMQLVVLTWEEVQEERQKALESDTFKKMLYRCYDCVLGFNHKFKLDNHMKKHEPEYGPEVCNICNIRCKHASALVAHKKRHQVKWRCSACGGAWSRASVAADHVSRAHHAANPTHQCSLCTQHFPTLNKLRLHMKQHSERVKCDQCDKTFVDRSAMRNHLFIHMGDKEFSCPHCDKKFLFKRAMEVHRATHDPDARIYCYSCDLSFKNEMSYKQHMLYSLKHVDPSRLKYACELCDKRFVKAKRLEEHHIAVHLKATPVKCTAPGCNFACSSRPVLRTHTRMLHRNARARRDHVCHLCGKTYTSKAALQGHLRAHSGERPLRCARCPAAFGYPAALYNHTRLVHLGHASGRNKTNEVSQTVTEATLAPLTAEHVDSRSMWSLTPTVEILQQPTDTLPS